MTLTLFLGLWLASYRLWLLLAKDVILERPRKVFYKRFPPDNQVAALMKVARPHKLGVFVACPYCSGFWLSGLVILIVQEYQSMSVPLLWWLAVSSAVGLTAKRFD